MTMLYSSQGTITFPLAAGNTLLINNISGVETVGSSTVSREDVSAVFGTGRVGYGPQTSAVTITLSTTGQCDYEIRVGDVTPSRDAIKIDPATGGLDTASAAVLAAGGAFAGPTGKLPKTYAAFRRVQDGLGDAFFGLFGDSTTLGAGAGTSTKGLTNAATNRPAAALVAYLNSIGIPAADNSFFGEGLIQAYQSVTFATYEPRFTVSGGASHVGDGTRESAGGVMWDVSATGKALNFTPQIGGANSYYDRVKVFYCNRTTGSFTVSQPGGGSTAGTITTNGASQTIGSTVVSLTRGTGACSLSWASGTNYIIGAVFYDSQNPRVNVLTFGHYGEKLTAANGPVNNIYEWRAGAVIASMSLDYCSIDMTVNHYPDGAGGVAAYTAALTSLATELAATTDVGICTPHAVGTANQGAVSDTYVAGARGVASALGLQVNDKYSKITPYATYSGTLYYDTLHPNIGGYHAVGYQTGRFLRSQSGV